MLIWEYCVIKECACMYMYNVDVHEGVHVDVHEDVHVP